MFLALEHVRLIYAAVFFPGIILYKRNTRRVDGSSFELKLSLLISAMIGQYALPELDVLMD